MPITSEAAKAERIDQVVALVDERVGGRAADVERFVRQYFALVDPGDLLHGTAGDHYGAAVMHWQLAQHRGPDEAIVRVYTPNFEQHGWQSPHTVVEVVADDMPFLVDSVTMELNRRGLGIHWVIHPVIKVQRNADGRLLSVLDAKADAADARPEAFLHLEVGRLTEAGLVEQLQRDLHRILGDVRAVVEDWAAMSAKVVDLLAETETDPPPLDGEDLGEARALLRWLAADHFTFLGYREYDLVSSDGTDVLRPVPGSGLGILREGDLEPRTTTLSPQAGKVARDRQLLVLTKANTRATVHRPSHLDYVGVKRFDASGAVVGERRFLGLYTVGAYSNSAFDIPVVRRKVSAVVRRAGFPPASHSEKNLIAVLETYPRDELFQASDDELFETAMGIVRIEERQRVRLFVRPDIYGRFFSCLVYLPRERYTTATEERMEEILRKALGGVSAEVTAHLSESVLARLHFVVHGGGADLNDIDVAALEARLAEATRSWVEDLLDALTEECGEEEGVRLHRRYRGAFPAAYREDLAPRSAVADVQRIEHLEGDGELGMTLYSPLEGPEGFLRFKLVRSAPAISLSDVLPLLENMGVTVVDEHPYEVKPRDRAPVWVYDFGLMLDSRGRLAMEGVSAAFQDSFTQVWRGAAENDGFNRLVLLAGLGWRDIVVLRAGCKYLRQTGTTFSQAYMEESLANNPDIARRLVELFHARFDPARQATAEGETARLVAAIETALDAVVSLDEDRILRGFLYLFRAVLRTNYFLTGPDGAPHGYLSFKVAPSMLPDLPLPRPAYEIFVYSPRTEGVHLRGAKVARGGIRWSDRREDFRTEVLGLMKAQTVKNAVIVPMGAKGGFVVKRPPAGGDRDALMAEVVACYQAFISGLLDLTDNLVAGEVVPPADVVRYDGDDPYLVVAADKGTATFSDIANAIALERGFWLGDAFASGGSAGYDHKKIGITARGAWESVHHHFSELGIDIQTTDFSVVGIGDMSGDVFGNGMLLSRHIKLVGAFDHRHIFIDPDPDPELSYAERARLFGLARSSWADYDAALISAGGGVFPRTAKSIPLSPQVRQVLGIDAGALDPNQLVNALLRAPVDLLWNGGIGTYVKATSETQLQAGDRTNDAVRVDARELRCRVVGEGGNLGLTQRARVEFALAGGLINTDAVDNSAGVDSPDHEVNIKILLDAVVADGDMTLKQRNLLLADMTDEVAGLVLRDNFEQTRALGRAKAQAASMVDVHARYIRSLEHAGGLDRELEYLPSEEALAERAAKGGGLTTPEFAILLAYTKILAYESLLASDVPDDPYFAGELARYFPAALRERFAGQLQRHSLRREIVANRLSNSVVNSAGTSFLFRMTEETGATTADIVRAHAVARQIFAMSRLGQQVEGCEQQLTVATHVAVLLEARKLIERSTRWLLRNRRPPLDCEATVRFFSAGVETLSKRLPDLVTGADRKAIEAATDALVGAGVPRELASTVAGFDDLFSALDLIEVAAALKRPVSDVAAVYFALGDQLELDWLRDRVIELPRGDRWQGLARDALRDDLYQERAALAADVMRISPGTDPDALIDVWATRNRGAVERALAMLTDIKAGATFDPTTLCVALREIRGL